MWPAKPKNIYLILYRKVYQPLPYRWAWKHRRDLGKGHDIFKDDHSGSSVEDKQKDEEIQERSSQNMQLNDQMDVSAINGNSESEQAGL